MVKCVELAFRCHLRDVSGEPTGACLFLYGLCWFSGSRLKICRNSRDHGHASTFVWFPKLATDVWVWLSKDMIGWGWCVPPSILKAQLYVRACLSAQFSPDGISATLFRCCSRVVYRVLRYNREDSTPGCDGEGRFVLPTSQGKIAEGCRTLMCRREENAPGRRPYTWLPQQLLLLSHLVPVEELWKEAGL
jgi:hypothetical protein